MSLPLVGELLVGHNVFRPNPMKPTSPLLPPVSRHPTTLTTYLTGVAGSACLLAAPQAEAAVTAVTFGFGQQDKRQRQIRRALPRDRPALLHGSGLRLRRDFQASWRQAASFSEGRIARAVSVA